MSLEADETGNLIGSDKVEGTAVYGAENNKNGSIERVMIDKKNGRASYAVLSFGGFLGIGDDHYPLPWQSLKYDTSLGGYVTGVTEAQLKGAPHYGNDNAWNWGDPTRTRAVNDYYGLRSDRGRTLNREGPPPGRALPSVFLSSAENYFLLFRVMGRPEAAHGKILFIIIAISVAILLAMSAYVISL